MWVILIGRWRLVCLRGLGILLLLLLDDGGLFIRGGSKEVDWLSDIHDFSSFLDIITINFTGLPVLKITWQHDASIWCLRLL